MQILELPIGESPELSLPSHVSGSQWDTSPSDTSSPTGSVSHISLHEQITIEYTSILKISTQPPIETPTDTLRTALLQILRQITSPQPVSITVNLTETLRSALILRCYFHISQGLADYPLEEISTLPPFPPDETSVNSTSALESWGSWTPVPQVSPSFCDPFLLLLSPATGMLDPKRYCSYLAPVIDDTGKALDAFVHEVYAHGRLYDDCGKRYYCLYDNCVYNMGPVAVSKEGFEKHLGCYHGIRGDYTCILWVELGSYGYL
ncbi:hypothetical protein TWF506_007191 [Arthrobotrys conoides]|uniref:Uncharacterized protein n=1 Tax=Arthrobotrys conoides TaxID=74498 RepID=A0AAN8RN23_9PEZI